ncbi:hypothetical protein chiPu_0020712 [Chiloscyllium punctatum]|uniref:Uncharacterized protein n=1 Tax=Chiloscyllium punctatum TaxID=137246 RepID=A0A401RIR7_CHIPU|nr:hypothetical protein [Chiloscyllium punctatum]
MAEHSELLTELPLVGKMTTQERLKHAHKRRAQQLKKWAQFEKDMQSKKVKHDKRKSDRGLKRIRFPDNVRLLEAASRNDVEEVRQLLESGMAPDLYNEDGLTALHQCCIDDYEEIVKLLLQAKADVNACDSELWTPLHAAATCGHLHLVQELIQHGANLLAVNADGNMPYDLCEDDVTLDYIESAMAQQDITQEKIDESRMATERWMIEDVQQLLESESDLNSQNDVGTSLVVRKVSVTERNNMYRKEHKEEAIVWQQVGSKESDPELQDEEDEDAQTDSELKQHGLNSTAQVTKGDEGPSEASWASGELTLRNGSAVLATALEQDAKGLASREEPPSDLSREKAHHTLADLKRQRAAAKLHKQLVPEEQSVRESAESVVSQPPNQSPPEQNSIYFTAASGDPPLVKFKAPVEEAPSEKSGRCCKMM